MEIPLTLEQSQAISASDNEPLRFVDTATDRIFVLVPADAYERVKPMLEDDFAIRDTYSAQFSSAMRAGWGDPEMDDYNHYEREFRS